MLHWGQGTMVRALAMLLERLTAAPESREKLMELQQSR
jgi:hypothetical protein